MLVHARKEKENDSKMKTIVIVMKGLLGATLVWMVLAFIPMIDRDIIDLTSITTLILTFRNIFLAGFYWGVFGIVTGVGLGATALFTLFQSAGTFDICFFVRA